MKARDVRRQDRDEALNELIDQIQSRTSLEKWNEFIRQVDVPSDLAAALVTMRPELINLIKPRALTEEEASTLYTLIKVLIETNAALQTHARETAKMVSIWANSFKQLQSLGRRIDHFANFRRSDEEYEVDSDC